jgi:membrane protein YdbS with pleckstrin-like domain
MKIHGRDVNRMWLVVPAVLLLLALHAGVLSYVFSHAGLSATVVGGILVVVVLKHLGLFASLFGLIRRRPRS